MSRIGQYSDSGYSTPSRLEHISTYASTEARSELEKLYNNLYGHRLCIVSEEIDAVNLQIAHVIQRATHPEILTKYEYCLGLNFKELHIDSRQNLLYLTIEMHHFFDTNCWLLLPDAGTLKDVHRHIEETIKLRKSSKHDADTTLSQWDLKRRPYTFVPTSLTKGFVRGTGGQEILHRHPYPDLPLLHCHIAPAFAIINAGPKFNKTHIDQIVRDRYPEQTAASQELQHRLTLVCDTWDLFMASGVEDDAKAWGKLHHAEDESVNSMKRTLSDAGDCISERSHDSSGALTLTEDAVSRQKTVDWKAGIRHWVAESTKASSLDPNLPLNFV